MKRTELVPPSTTALLHWDLTSCQNKNNHKIVAFQPAATAPKTLRALQVNEHKMTPLTSTWLIGKQL